MTFAAGRLRPSKLTNSRFPKSEHRINRIANIARVTRAARKMFTGSAFAAATFGHQAGGVSNSQVVTLERAALACSGLSPKGRCRTIALCAVFGINGSTRAGPTRETLRD